MALSESMALSVLLLLIFGAATVYLYSRITYTEKRLSMMESLLVDIKMMIEGSTQTEAPAPPVMPLASAYHVPEPVDESVYAAVLEQVQEAPVAVAPVAVAPVDTDTSSATGAVEDSQKVGPNYDAMTRAELAALAEQRNLRVTKRTGRGEIINLLRKADSSNNGPAATGENASSGTVEPVGGELSLDTGNAGADLEEVDM
jgi:hypothetical protein